MLVRIAVPLADDAHASKKSWSNLFEPQDSRIERVVAQHLSALARKRLQLLIPNDYGKHQKKGWEKELSYFLSHVLIPEMPWWHPLRQKPPSARQLTKAAKIVERLVSKECDLLRSKVQDVTVPRDGVAYELFCQRILETNGWKVTATKKSGDQGVDLIAQLGSSLVALQCKRFGRPVGNKAVQEITAGRQFYRAEVAAIITNAGYTEAARSLAAANGIFLLHHSDLPRLGEKIATQFDKKE
jgi:restriction system protein